MQIKHQNGRVLMVVVAYVLLQKLPVVVHMASWSASVFFLYMFAGIIAVFFPTLYLL